MKHIKYTTNLVWSLQSSHLYGLRMGDHECHLCCAEQGIICLSISHLPCSSLTSKSQVTFITEFSRVLLKTLESPGDTVKLLLAIWWIEGRTVRQFKGKNGSKDVDILCFYNTAPSALVCWVMATKQKGIISRALHSTSLIWYSPSSHLTCICCA